MHLSLRVSALNGRIHGDGPVRRHHHRHGRRRRYARPSARSDRQADPAARTRRLRAAREGELGLARGRRREPLPHQGAVARREGQGVPRRRALLCRRQHQVLRRRADPAPRARLRRSATLSRRLTRVAHRLRRARAVLHAGGAPVSRPRHPRRRPDRAAGDGTVPPSAAQPRAANPAARRRSHAARPPAVPDAHRGHARRGEPAEEPLHPVRHL